jgi:hypothetical protein
MNDEEKVALLQHFMGWLNGMGYHIRDDEAPLAPPSSSELITHYLQDDYLEEDGRDQYSCFLNGLYDGQQTRARFNADHARGY